MQGAPKPQTKGVEESNLTVHVTLVTGKGNESMVLELLGKGILDSACTKCVAGSAWMDEFISTLSEEEKLMVRKSTVKSDSIFRFGDGVQSRSFECVKIPVFFGKKRRVLKVDIVDNEIPLLISKPAMKNLRMKLDFENDG